MTKFRLEFEIEMFIEEWRPTLIEYFKGDITAQEASKRLGMSRGRWEMNMGNIFTAATSPKHPFASIEEIEEEQ